MSDTRQTSSPRAGIEPNGELLNRVQQIRLDNQIGMAKSGGGGASWLPWVLCILLSSTWALVGIRWYRSLPNAEATSTASNSGAGASSNSSSNSTGSPVEAGTIQLEVKGYLIPSRQIAVSPIDVGGRLIDLDAATGRVYNIVEGRYYKEGDILAQIDPANYAAAFSESSAALSAAQQRLATSEQRLAEITLIREAEVTQVKALVAESEALRELARSELGRLSSLPGVSQQEQDKARSEVKASEARVAKITADMEILIKGRPAKVKAAEADVEASKADVKVAEARVIQSRWRMDNCTIRAPISGTVLTKKAEKGSLVNPMAFGATSGSVCDMADLAKMEADLEIPERDIAKLKINQPCRIRVDAYPEKVYQGELDRIMPIANRGKSIVNVRVRVILPADEKPGSYLKPDMGAVVSFLPMKEEKK